MTMLLTTRTDMFGAAVSHAGISSISSSISSCWGEGNWGFASSAAATAKSYPWNRPDIYIDESPLFAADKVVTPLLHGAVDNNVPPGESEQMYTALRVLGKEVEYIRIDDELHWVLQYDRRWSESIVARFDKHLKDDAAWWRHLWPEDE
jgi:dipeptidyl aminopeptidase/acylaminoacyl peptidase